MPNSINHMDFMMCNGHRLRSLLTLSWDFIHNLDKCQYSSVDYASTFFKNFVIKTKNSMKLRNQW